MAKTAAVGKKPDPALARLERRIEKRKALIAREQAALKEDRQALKEARAKQKV